MIQKKFLCRNTEEAEKAVAAIADLVSATKHRSSLVTIYEKGFRAQEIGDLISRLKWACPGLQTAAIALTLIAELMPEGTGILLNLLLTEETDIEVVTVPCLPGGETAAAGVLRSRLFAHEQVKAVEFFGSNMALNTTAFIEKSMEGHEDAVLFGTSTLRSVAQKISMSDNENEYTIEQVSQDLKGDDFIAGDKILYDGFVAILFAGEKLRVNAKYALGWRPIGRKLSIELGSEPAMGETVVTRIDDAPAADIYREYLGVQPDSFFISNICEFPFVVEREGINMCMIPLDHGKNGELYFMMTLRPGENLRFTFASHDELMYASWESLHIMESFRPEALFLTLCGNRLNFLKEDAHMEWDGFGKVAPDYALMHGAGELFYHQGRGGILNSAHLAIGMRESEEAADTASFDHPTIESLRQGRTLSLSDRMSTFLAKITTELIDMAGEAQNANKAKSVFLSHMSHEIRTPINAILGMDEMILRESGEKEILDYADRIRSAGNNLLGIVNDILDFSKIEAGRMNIVPAEYDLKSVIKDMYNVVRLRAESKGLDVKFDIDGTLPSVLYGDALRIRQTVTNLLTNAVKYTEVGTVTFTMQKVSDGTSADEEALRRACPGERLPDQSVRIRFSVSDTGIGIRPEDMEKLFVEYERFDEKRNHAIEGTGLGLSITRELLELMGSRLKAESTYGKGSTFSFEILQGVIDATPVKNEEDRWKEPVSTRKRTSFTAEDARILIVDDTELNLVVFKNLIKHLGIRIDTAASGEEALRLVRVQAYDVIFLDERMPGMSGSETLKNMLALTDNLSAGVPVISLTSDAGKNARGEFVKIGFKDYLPKPIDPEVLEDMLFFYIPPEKIRTVTENG
ncbi:MAG: response regulator [Lachnospiraceae bacterium]|nr:response regulator [Lachnospiraceae bacterium]